MAWKESLTVGGCCQIETNDQYIQVMTFMSYLWHNTGNTVGEAGKTLFLPLYEKYETLTENAFNLKDKCILWL